MNDDPGRVGATLRRLTRGDAGDYHAFRVAQLAASPAAFTSTAAEERERPASWAADRIASSERPHDFILGAFDPTGALMGVAGLSVPAQRQVRHKATLFGMAVAIEARGRGTGRMLLRRLLRDAGAIEHLLQIVLTVSEGNEAAVRLYASAGFEPFGREPRAVIVAGEPIAKLHMMRRLDVATMAVPQATPRLGG